MADSVLKQIYNDCKAKIEALVPRSYWNNAERFKVYSDAKSENQLANDATHRNVFMGYSGETEDLSPLSMGQNLFMKRTLSIQIIYETAQFGRPEMEKVTTMIAEDTDDIIEALQSLAGFPAITGGYMYHRLFTSDQVVPDVDRGMMNLILNFAITYGK